MTPQDKAPERKFCPVWEEQELIDRLSKCRQMLYLHGVLPAGENEKIKLRIAKLAKKEGV